MFLQIKWRIRYIIFQNTPSTGYNGRQELSWVVSVKILVGYEGILWLTVVIKSFTVTPDKVYPLESSHTF